MFVQERKMVIIPMVSQAHYLDKDDAMLELFFDTFCEFHDTIDEFLVHTLIWMRIFLIP